VHRHTFTLWLLCSGALLLGCSDEGESNSAVPSAPTFDRASAGSVVAGDPLPGLSALERSRFERGGELFEQEFEPATGLGPLFNEVSCQECHEDPARGGSGDEVETHATVRLADGSCSELTEGGGPVFQLHATPALLELGIEREPIPSYVTVIANRTSAPLFGLGLLDAVPEATILALADPDDTNGDGISGRPNLTPDGRVGRFGRKAAVASLHEFNAGAFRDEMGVTSPAVPDEGNIGGAALPPGVDPLPEPEIDQETLDLTDAFVRLLAPVSPLKPTKQARDGRELFAQINCAGCHVPALRTGDNPVKALQHKEVAAYTDLLLHDMGPELADICRVTASEAEFRTQPLMGLRLLPHFMHDGRAQTIQDAIQTHGGEAAGSRERFNQLSDAQRDAVLAFLRSL
jgi:CxxC motif-containing protein (DUF1111 family)